MKFTHISQITPGEVIKVSHPDFPEEIYFEAAQHRLGGLILDFEDLELVSRTGSEITHGYVLLLGPKDLGPLDSASCGCKIGSFILSNRNEMGKALTRTKLFQHKGSWLKIKDGLVEKIYRTSDKIQLYLTGQHW